MAEHKLPITLVDAAGSPLAVYAEYTKNVKEIMPAAGVDLVGVSILYLGRSTADFTLGHTYTCRLQGSEYVWVDVTPAGSSDPSSLLRSIPFEVSDNAGSNVLLTREILGVTYGAPEYDVIDPMGYNITADTRLSRRWTDDGYLMTFLGGWAPGTYQVKTVSVSGESSCSGIISQNEDGNEITLQGVRGLGMSGSRVTLTDGGLLARASDGDSQGDLRLDASGRMSWSGNIMIATAGGEDNNATLRTEDTTASLDVGVGSTLYKGGFIRAYGIDHHEDIPGGIGMYATDGEQIVGRLVVRPNGKPYANGQEVVAVTSWSSGTSWYRKYSDGWAEQGGKWENTTENSTKVITLPVAMLNTSYSLVASYAGTAKSSDSYDYGSVGGVVTSRSTITLSSSRGSGNNVVWRVCGWWK